MSKHRPQHIPTKELPIFVTKTDDALGIVEAIVSVFGVIDDGLDVIHAGAYTKTIAERGGRVRVLDQHNTDSIMRVIGKPLEMREVGRADLPAEVLERFPEATGGLLTRSQFLMDTPEGDGAYKRIKSGAVGEYSIGYEALDYDYSKATRDGKQVTVRNLRTIKLWEYSPVIWGMNPATATAGVKNEDPVNEQQKQPETKATTQTRQMGDVLTAAMLTSAYTWINSWLSKSQITREERSAIVTAVEAAVDSVYNSLPDDIAVRPLAASDSYWYWDSLDVELTSKGFTPDEINQLKAGRALSTRNTERIQSAIDALTALLADANGEDDEKRKPADPPKTTPPQAGPDDEPPTDDAQGDFDQEDEIKRGLDELMAMRAKATMLSTSR